MFPAHVGFQQTAEGSTMVIMDAIEEGLWCKSIFEEIIGQPRGVILLAAITALQSL